MTAGDCWIWLSLASSNGLILAARVGKRVDRILEELVVSTEGKTDCVDWKTDGWGGYPRVLPEEVNHKVGKMGTQRKRENQRNHPTANGQVASTSKQVWQGLGANKSNSQVSR